MKNKNKFKHTTGERVYLEIIDNVTFEHVHRYFMAKDFVKNKIVLDAACGSGYGSYFLSLFANFVYAVDLNNEVINQNCKKYQNNNLKYIYSSVENLPFEDKYFDVIVSFETIEHVKDYYKVMLEFKRVLKNDGLLIISTPNKKISDINKIDNPFHAKEFYEDEFIDLINNFFKNTILFYQTSSYISSILKKEYRVNGQVEVLNFNVDQLRNGYITIETDKDYWYKNYFIVIASNVKIDYNMNASLLNANKFYENKIKFIEKIYESTNYKLGYYLTYPFKFVLHKLRIRNYPDI
jgi:ubiquinone/menaquinone biosynthesis C-methylase UbiE